MNPMKSLFAGILLTACGVSAAQDCSDFAGDWMGTYSETDCFGDPFSGDWTAVVSGSCAFTGATDFESINGTIDPITGVLTASGPSLECGVISLTATFQSNSMTGGYTYSAGGSGSISGSKQFVDSDGDGDPDSTDPDDDNDGIGDALDTEPLTASNNCTGGDDTNATLQSNVVVDLTCAARETITVLPLTTVQDPGHLHLISPTVIFQSDFASGSLIVTSADPCPGCSP